MIFTMTRISPDRYFLCVSKDREEMREGGAQARRRCIQIRPASSAFLLQAVGLRVLSAGVGPQQAHVLWGVGWDTEGNAFFLSGYF